MDIRELMARLMEAVEASLSTSAAVREALEELVRNGYEARLFFVANAESAERAGAAFEEAGAEADEGLGEEEVEEPEEAPAPVVPEIGAAPGELRFELTKLDRDFLKSLQIRPESG